MKSVAELLAESNWDLGRLRPWRSGDKVYTTRTDGTGFNRVETDTLAIWTKEQWVELDRIVMQEFKKACPLVTDLVSRLGLVYRIPNMLKKCELQFESVGSQEIWRAGASVETMLSLPIIYHGCVLGGDTPTNADTLRFSAKCVGDKIEQSLHAALRGHVKPVGSYKEGLEYLESANYWGPYGYFQLLGDTENDKLGLAMVQLTPDVIHIVEGLPPTLVQWDGCLHKVLTIMVPQMRKDYDGNCGAVLIS